MTHGRIPVPTEKPFYEAAGKQTQFPGRFFRRAPSNASAAGAGLPGHLLPIGPALSTAPAASRPPIFFTTAALGKIGWAPGGRNKELRSAQPGDRRRGKEGTEGLTLRVSLSYRWRDGPHFNAPNPLHRGEDAGQVEGKGDGKVDRSVQTRKRKGSASLVNPGWQR